MYFQIKNKINVTWLIVSLHVGLSFKFFHCVSTFSRDNLIRNIFTFGALQVVVVDGYIYIGVSAGTTARALVIFSHRM